MRSMSCFCRKRETTSGPKVKETPRSFSLQPVMSLSGSDHNKSHKRPQSGICKSQWFTMHTCAAIRAGLREKQQWTHICWAHDPTDLLHRVQIRTQTSMHCEDLFVDDCCDGQAIEAVGESLPQLDIVPPLALIIEPVNTIDRGTFMVTSKDEEILRIFDLVREEQTNGL